MTVWEIVIMMVVGTLCATCGIGMIYASIVNTVERYQIRKTKRSLEIYTQVINELPGAFKKMVEMLEEKEKKDQEKFEKRMKDLKQDE